MFGTVRSGGRKVRAYLASHRGPEIARAHHALIIDLIDRVAELEARAGTESGGRRSSHSPKSAAETRPTGE